MSNNNMETILLTIGLMTVAVLIMAVGLFFGRAPIKGSCGGGSCACSDTSCENRKNPSVM